MGIKARNNKSIVMSRQPNGTKAIGDFAVTTVLHAILSVRT